MVSGRIERQSRGSAAQVLPCPVSASEILLDNALTVTEGDKTYDISVEEALRQRTFQDAGLQVGTWRCARWSSGSSCTTPGWQGRTAINFEAFQPVDGRLGYPVLASQVGHLRPGLMLLQHSDYPLFREPCSLHLSVLRQAGL
jgi:hypothetical protein